MGEFEHLQTLDTMHNHARCQVIRMNILLSAPSRPSPLTLLSLGVIVDPLSYFAAESFPVAAEVVRSLDVERILEVGEVGEETVEAPDHVLDPPGGGPAQPVEAVRSEEGEADGAADGTPDGMSEGTADNPQPSSASQTLSGDFLVHDDQFFLGVSGGGALGEQAVSPLHQNNQEHFSSFSSVGSLDSDAAVDSDDKEPVVEVTGPGAAAEQSAAASAAA